MMGLCWALPAWAWPPPGSPAESKLDQARALRAAGRLDPAVDTYEELLRLQPEDPDVFIEIAEVLAWLKDYQVAQAYLEAALEHRPGDLEILRRVALYRSWQGDLDGADQLYEALLMRAPGDAELLLRSAELSYWRLDFARARARLAALFADHPDHVEGRKLQAQLEAVKLNRLQTWAGHSNTVKQPEWWKYGLLYRRELHPKLAAWVKAEVEERFDVEARKLGGGIELKLPAAISFYGGYTGSDRGDFVPGEDYDLALARPLSAELTAVLGYQRQRYRAGVVDIPWGALAWQATARLKLTGRCLLVQLLEGGTGDGYALDAELCVHARWTLLAGLSTGFDTQYLVTTNRAAPRRVVGGTLGLRVELGDFDITARYGYQYREGVAYGDRRGDFFTRQDFTLGLGYRF